MKRKIIALTLAFTMFFEIITPNIAFALTGGPSAPEVESFEPISTSEMVNLFSGDFNYNIPLLDVGGYPVNIFYNSGVTMDQEASWVGLGWNLNPGCITRNMRGLPDDFSGQDDCTEKDFNIKDNKTYGISFGWAGEIAGHKAFTLNYGVGVNYNNYNGVGIEQYVSANINSAKNGKGPLNGSLGLRSSNSGLDISPNVSYSKIIKDAANGDSKLSTSIGTSFNTRSGLKQLALGIGFSRGSNSKGGIDQIVQHDYKDQSTVSFRQFEGVNGGTSISFASSTYTPQVSLPLHNFSLNLSVKWGGDVVIADPTHNISGYYSEQNLSTKYERIPAYGYLYSDAGQTLSKVLMDFNREKDGNYTDKTPNLPVTNFTYDLFTVSGQGVGGMFRPHRNDIGTLFDSRNSTYSDGLNAGGEFAAGNTAKTGFDYTINSVNTISGKWDAHNDAQSYLTFKSGSTFCDEPYYFKEAGERNVNSLSDYFNYLKGEEPIRIKIFDAGGLESAASSTFLDNSQNFKNNPGTPFAPAIPFPHSRQPRNQHFSFITKNEYEKFANDPSLINQIYDYTTGTGNTGNKFPKTGRHIGEITTLKTDGSRYIYGIPVYNTLQQEVSFNVSKNPNKTDLLVNQLEGTVQYNKSDDNSTDNSRGNEYYNSSKLSPYAYAYLLTEVLSPDYVDLTGNGPSNDDFGTYTKFEYERVNRADGSSPNPYKWRVPYARLTANYNEGLKTKDDDDQGNYLYGEKEIYILKRIVTKNFIAIFFSSSNRHDAFGAWDENGGYLAGTSQASRLLDSIGLYSNTSQNFDLNGSLITGGPNPAIPIKVVHFVYDYSLCKDISSTQTNNNDRSLTNADYGKLTLKQIYFTYGKSNKARLSPYEFAYCDPTHTGIIDNNYNPDYDLKGYNRWGNYKPNVSAGGNAEFPYVVQDKSHEDIYSAAWSLSTIYLPSGGIIKVDYESDDYAYVQDRPAMQMFQITGVGNDPTIDNPENQNSLNGNYYLYIKLNEIIPGSKTQAEADAIFQNQYLSSIKDLYFRFFIEVNKKLQKKEYVSGYIPSSAWSIGNCKTMSNGTDYNYAYIRINNPGGNAYDHPIIKTALQFARIYTPEEAYNYPRPTTDDPVSILLTILDVGLFKQLYETFIAGPNGFLFGEGLGFYFERSKSWIRLNNPEMKKLGGGCRVRQLSISDSWGEMLEPSDGDRTFDYGQVYDYTTTTDEPTNPRTISSGVASYEPLLGNDENPFRQPVTFSDDNLLAPSNDYYVEEPFGECFFPGPSVGYSKVTVRNLPRTYNSHPLTRTATGKTVHEFFTAKDFPTITKQTPLDPLPQKSGLLGNLLKLNARDRMTTSQGYSIVLNNMHGKEKAQWVYAENEPAPISGIEYKYLSHGKALDNKVTVVDENGFVTNDKEIGVDYDMVADMRQEETNADNVGVMANLYGFVLFIPCIVTPILPTFSHENTRFRSAVFTKVINKFGILDKTIVYDVGSHVETQNKTFDAVTGEVLMTKTTNEFNDDNYSFNYPAYWAYDGMGPAFKNTSAYISGINIDASTGKITSGNTGGLFPGDEVEFIGHPQWEKYWYIKTGTDYYFKSRNGDVDFSPLSGNISVNVKIIRSGRRNEQGSSIGSFVSKESPLPTTGKIGNITSGVGIITAAASEFSEDYQTFCQCAVITSWEPNPYIIGLKGNWRKKVSYAYLTDRVASNKNNNTNIRSDGIFHDYSSFWNPASNALAMNNCDPNSKSPWVKDPLSHWTWTSMVTQYSPYGFEVENVDALNRYSSAQYSYNNSFPVGVSANAKHQEMGVDNMEDYSQNSCKDSHFTFYNTGTQATVTTTKAEHHSGKYSLVVPVSTKAIMVKHLNTCPGNGGVPIDPLHQ